MASITVPAEFFRSELRIYSDWRTAFCRELLQNALDASPTRIDITFETVDGHGRVTFADDGHGMTRQVLEDVYFALGRTTKTGPDTIGGFGRARLVTCFAQTRYTIRTGHLVADGVGGEYTIRHDPTCVKGTTFTIDLIDDNHHQVESEMAGLLGSSSLKVPVYINGYQQYTPPTPPRAARILRDEDRDPWARVYVEPGYGRMTVRVHGLQTFIQWLSGSDNVIVELLPARAREVLTASRDSLHETFKTQLDKFVADLALNRRSALAANATPLESRIGGGGFLATDAPRPLEPQADANDPSTTASPTAEHLTRVTPANAAAFINMAARTDAGAAPMASLFDDFDEEPVNPIGFDVFLLAEANDARVRKLTRAWDPSSWSARTPRNRRALLFAWKTAVSEVLDTFVALQPDLGRVLWTVGWVFDDTALHKDTGDGHVLALNPVGDDGKIAWRLSQRAARQRLISVAAHEVVHVTQGYHNERFASLLTELFGALDVADVDRKIRAAIAAA